MDYVTISVEEYNNAVEKGLDIVSYMKGRMDEAKAAKGLTGIFKEAYRNDYSLIVNGITFHVGERVRFGEVDEPWVIEEIDNSPSTCMPVLLERGNSSQWPDYGDLEDMKLVKK